MKMTSTKSIYICLLSMMLIVFQNAYATDFDRIVVFGDSLSDNGNIFSLTSKASRVIPMVPVIPKNPPYYKGRFSNGPVWIDNLALAFDVPLDDYAYGGSWAEPLRESGLLIPFGLGNQVNYYLVGNVTDRHKENHLFIIWSGGNDYVQGRDDVDEATDKTIDSIRNNLEWLVYYGAQNVMVMNLPDLSVVPEVRSENPDRVQNVDKLVKMHNAKLAKMIKEEQEKYPDAKIIFADITSYFNDAYRNPEKYNIKNVNQACYGGDYYLRGIDNLIDPEELAAAKKEKIDVMRSPSLRTAYLTAKLADSGEQPCSNPDEYMFWDHIHPTRVIHHLMAMDAKEILDKNGFKAIAKQKV